MAHLADVLVPPNEEGTRATILRWCKQVGDTVVKNEPLLELETDKVTVEIPAPADGTLVEVLKQVDAEVIPDEVLARLSLRSEAAPVQDTVPAPASAASPVPASVASPVPQPAAGALAARAPLSPSVRRLLKEHSLDVTHINGTGRDGRVTAQDVTRHAANAAPRAGPPMRPIPC